MIRPEKSLLARNRCTINEFTHGGNLHKSGIWRGDFLDQPKFTRAEENYPIPARMGVCEVEATQNSKLNIVK
jgi:hypothetical protein